MTLSDTNPPALPEAAVSPARLAAAICWSLLIALGGGMACGWCIDTRFGELGAASLIACGAFAGYVSRRITAGPSRVAAIAQAIAIGIALLIAETCWIHWNMRSGEESWWAAVCAWPKFVDSFSISAVIGAACGVYGAWWAYSNASGTGSRSA